MDELKKQLLDAIKSFIDERFKSLESKVKTLEEENNQLKSAIASLPTKALNGIDGAPGKDGQNGRDGKDFDQLVAKDMLKLMFEPYKMKLDDIKDGKDGRDGINGNDGLDGKDGVNGQDGASAYDIAVKYGFDGTELEFAQKQFGKDGSPGEKGKDGANGKDGASAYEIATAYGFKGTQLEFAQKQIGADGRDGQDGKDGIDGLGFDDLKVEFDGERTVSLKFLAEGNKKEYSFEIPAQIYKGVYKEGQKYTTGDTVTDNGSLWSCLKATDERPISAPSGYWQLAVKHGSKGEKGSPGNSAYDLAINNGFTGSEKEYLASLRRGVNS